MTRKFQVKQFGLAFITTLALVITLGLSASVQAANHDPVIASLKAAPNPATVTSSAGIDVKFTAVATDQDSGDTLTFKWDFGDTETDTTMTGAVTHHYANTGYFTVTLTVDDGNGGQAVKTIKVAVDPLKFTIDSAAVKFAFAKPAKAKKGVSASAGVTASAVLNKDGLAFFGSLPVTVSAIGGKAKGGNNGPTGRTIQFDVFQEDGSEVALGPLFEIAANGQSQKIKGVQCKLLSNKGKNATAGTLLYQLKLTHATLFAAFRTACDPDLVSSSVSASAKGKPAPVSETCPIRVHYNFGPGAGVTFSATSVSQSADALLNADYTLKPTSGTLVKKKAK